MIPIRAMNGTPAAPRQIQIIAPFTAALEWMKMVLFSPFDIAKWLTIAFAAFIAGNVNTNFGLNKFWNAGDWKYSFRKQGDLPWNVDFTPWLIALVGAVVLFALIVGIVWAWVSSRGRFIFTDCLVKNRGAIAEPWNEFRREGNSFFLFSLAVMFCTFVLVAIFGGLMWLLFAGRNSENASSGGPVVIFCVIIFALFWLVFSILFGLISHFMIPVMYRRRCLAREAFVDVAKLILANPGPFILFALFGCALVIAVAVVGSMIACVTCCIGGLPYISTVILLPAIVWLAAYKLLFIRQFGDAYDVWATIVTPVQTTEPLPPPTAT
jgi:hypothetical protein